MEKIALNKETETLLIPLYCRALESQRPDPIIRDDKAVEMANRIDYDFSQLKVPKGTYIITCMRAKQYDNYAQSFLSKNPDGVVVCIGCGLDSRFDRVDNGKVEWYDLDFPEVIDLRRKFFQEMNRYHFISSSVMDFEWMTPIAQKNRRVLFLAEGVLMYLHEEEVKSLVLKLQETFPGCELACEVTNIFWVKKMQQGYMKRNFQRRFNLEGDVIFHWGIKYGHELKSWNRGIHLLDEWTYFDESEKKLGWMRIFGRISLLRKAQ